MDDQNINEATENEAVVSDDQSAYLTAVCLMGFGAAVGIGVTKGYKTVKNVVARRVQKHQDRKFLSECAEMNQEIKASAVEV